jgi:hypothetical protein
MALFRRAIARARERFSRRISVQIECVSILVNFFVAGEESKDEKLPIDSEFTLRLCVGASGGRPPCGRAAPPANFCPNIWHFFNSCSTTLHFSARPIILFWTFCSALHCFAQPSYIFCLSSARPSYIFLWFWGNPLTDSTAFPVGCLTRLAR